MTERTWFRAGVTATVVAVCGGLVAVMLSTVGEPEPTLEERITVWLEEMETRDVDLAPYGVRAYLIEDSALEVILTERGVNQLVGFERDLGRKREQLHDWVRALDGGATSRRELMEICADVPEDGYGARYSPQSPGEEIAWVRAEDRMLAKTCAEVRTGPESRTLRQWADLIEERLGPAPEHDEFLEAIDIPTRSR